MVVAGLMHVRGKANLKQDRRVFELMDLRIDDEIERLEKVIESRDREGK